jgi:hypothetical protein
MLRFSFLRRIGVPSDIAFRSVSRDNNFLKTQLHKVGNKQHALAPAASLHAVKQEQAEKDIEMIKANQQEQAAAAAEGKAATATAAAAGTAAAESDSFSRRMTQDELNRFTTSLWSKENLHNYKAGTTPTLIVDVETGLTEGVNYPDPCRYGTEIEYNGIVSDF